jgi:hypothetical protein
MKKIHYAWFVLSLAASFCFANNSDGNIVGWWHLDESSGDTVFDASGRGNNGIAHGTTIVAGTFGSARSFNGTNDYISIPTNGFPTGNSPRTLEAWIYQRSLNSRGTIVGYGGGGIDDNNEFRLTVNEFSPGQLSLELSNNGWYANTLLKINTWYHIAVAYEGSGSPVFFVNGDSVAATSTWGSPVVNTTSDFGAIGIRTTTDYPFNGIIDEVRIWDIAINPTSNGNIVGWWHLDESSGDTVFDASGRGNNGIAHGTTIVAGTFGSARSFNGTNDYISIPTNGFPTGDSPRTLEARIYQRSLNSRGTIVGYGGGDDNTEFRLTVNEIAPGQLSLELNNSGWYANTLLKINTWYHIAVAYKGSGSPVFFVNGYSVAATSTWGSPVVNTTSDFGAIGIRTTTDYPFNGIIDEVRIWDNYISMGTYTSVQFKNQLDANNFILHQNYPNPFNPSTIISFSLPSKSFVSLKVFDLIGREVATILSQEMQAGSHSQQWNTTNMTSGVYFYRLQAGSFIETKKLIMLK